MQTNIHEIADGVYRLSTTIPDAAPGGFTFNQYLIGGDEPLLFHAGARQLFPLVSDAVAKVIDLDALRWVSFGHVESDECGAVNQWLAAAPGAEVAFNPLGCMVSLNDLCDRLPRALPDGEVIDLGGHRVRAIATPHVPHGWEAQVLFDETSRTLFCGDLFTQTGEGPAIVHDADLIQPALDAEDLFGATGLTAATAPTIRSLADLEPRTLALMHGPAFAGDCRRALLDLADVYEDRFRASVELAGGGRLMRQLLTADTVERYIEAPPEVLYDIVADISRTPELTPDIVRCEWLDGATGPVVGARFKAVNHQGRGPDWRNKPVIVTVDPGREIAWARTEPFAGTLEWRYRFVAEGTGTRVVESYTVTKPLTIVGWFIIGTLYGMKDRQTDMRASMQSTLERLAGMTEAADSEPMADIPRSADPA